MKFESKLRPDAGPVFTARGGEFPPHDVYVEVEERDGVLVIRFHRHEYFEESKAWRFGGAFGEG